MYVLYIHTYFHTSPPFPTYTHPNLTKTENKAFLPRCPRLLECYSSYYSANHAATAPYVCDRESWHNLQTLAALLLFFPFSSESRSNRPPLPSFPRPRNYALPTPPQSDSPFFMGIYPHLPAVTSDPDLFLLSSNSPPFSRNEPGKQTQTSKVFAILLPIAR